MNKIFVIIASLILRVTCVKEAEWNKPLSIDDAKYPWCGPNMRCIPPTHCINGTLDENGIAYIGPRAECSNILHCCSMSAVDENPISPFEDIPPGCGYRRPGGFQIRLQNKTNEAEYGEFPWMVAVLVNETTYHCGGSILHPRVVLTAAHRVFNMLPSWLKVRAGDWERNAEHEPFPHQDRKVERTTIHTYYRRGTLSNNVALLILKSAFVWTSHISPVCLPYFGHRQRPIGDCVVTGWGKPEFTSKLYANFLKKIDLNTITRSRCQTKLRKTRLGPEFTLKMSHICAGGEAGKDACTGDGGSALVCPIPNTEYRYYQVGVVSAGVGCGLPNVPGVYADTAYLLPWIENQFKLNNFNLTYLP